MAVSFGSRFRNAWNALMGSSESNSSYTTMGSSLRPDRPRLSRGNEKSIVTAIYNRIAIDIAQVGIKHVLLDDKGRFSKILDTPLNECLTLSANRDQTSRAFWQDVGLSLMDEGCIAIVPEYTSIDPRFTDSYDVFSLRTAKIVQWYPKSVRVLMYDDKTGSKKEATFLKSMVAIVENPLYAVMNEPNSVAQRLIRKLNLLDSVDEQNSSGKLDLIIQLPYTVKSEQKKAQADRRRKEIEEQLVGSKYGIAYTDSTEKITQLNRAVENNLMKQVEYLTSMLMSQLGITQNIMDGSADEVAMMNYTNRTIEPFVSAIVDELNRKFISRTARTQGKAIVFFKEPFRLVSVNNLAELADKLTRNEILTANEVRQVIGYMPSTDPNADVLRNKNLNPEKGAVQQTVFGDEEIQNGNTVERS